MAHAKKTAKKTAKTSKKTHAKKKSTSKTHHANAKSGTSKTPNMAVAAGHTVSVDYIGTLNNGEEFDNSAKHGPISFVVGQGHVIKGFDNAVIGMKQNEKKKFTIKKEAAYGDVNPAMVHKVPLDKLSPEIKEQVKIGGFLVMQSPAGQQIPAKVIALDNKEATLDLNHPLAGKDLTFEIIVREIKLGQAPEKKACDCGHDHSDHEDSECCGGDCCK